MKNPFWDYCWNYEGKTTFEEAVQVTLWLAHVIGVGALAIGAVSLSIIYPTLILPGVGLVLLSWVGYCFIHAYLETRS